MRWLRKEARYTPIFKWAHCRKCNTVECQMPDALISIDPRPSQIPPRDIVGWAWEIHVTTGYPKNLTISSVEAPATKDQAMFAAQEAYCKWRGLR